MLVTMRVMRRVIVSVGDDASCEEGNSVARKI